MTDEERLLVGKVLDYLAVTDTDPLVLDVQRPGILKLRCRLQRELFETRERVRMPNYKPDPKDKDTPRYTDFDRKIMNDAAVAQLQEDYELVRGLEDLVAERIELMKEIK